MTPPLLRRSPKETDTAAVSIPDVDGLTPPAPSARYRREPTYAAGQSDLPSGTRQRAYAGWRAWSDRRSGISPQVHAWLAEAGLMGEGGRSAYLAYIGATRLRRQAQADVAAAGARHADALAGLAGDVTAARAGAALPSGDATLKAELDLLAAELVLAEVKRSEQAVNLAWGKTIDMANWPAILAQVELLDGPQAERAAQWLKGKLDPGPGPGVDPLAWI